MGIASRDEALSKGPVVRALDEMSSDSNALQRLTELRDQLNRALVFPFEELPGVKDVRRPDFPTLTDVLKNHLLIYWSKMNPGGKLDQAALDQIADYLEKNWFGQKPQEYPAFPTRGLYGLGLIKALDSSLRGKSSPLPIDSYWFTHNDRFEVISLESERQVTLLIATPPPVGALYATSNPRAACEAWVTTATDRAVGLEVSPPDLDPNQPIAAGAGLVNRSGYRICTYKIVGGP